MTQTVTLPDGNSFQFPDGMPPEKMKALIQQSQGGAGGGTPAPPPPEALSPQAVAKGFGERVDSSGTPRELTASEKVNQMALEQTPDFLKPAMKGVNWFNDFMEQVGSYATLGLKDEVAGAAKGTAHLLAGDDTPFSENFAQGKSAELARKEAYAEENPIASKVAAGLGMIGSGGSGSTAAVPALTATGKVALPSALMQGAKAGATVGAISGAGEAEGGLGDRLEGAATGGAEGAAGGAILGSLFNALPKGADVVRGLFGGQRTAQNVGALEAAGIEPTLLAASTSRTAQGAENVAKTAPLVDDWAAASAQRSLDQMQGAAENVAGGYGTAATSYEAGQAAQRGIEGFRGEKLDPNTRMPLTDAQRIAGQPTGGSSFREKERALYTLAENEIPQGERFLTRNTYMTLQSLANPLRSNPQVGGTQVKQGVRDLLEQLTANPRMTFQDIQALRTRVGNRLSGDSTEFPDVATQELQSLYRGLTGDMRAAAERSGPRALQLWERANNYASAGRDRLQSLMSITGAKSPEQAYGAVLRAASNAQGQGNRQLLQAARRSMQPDEWNDVVAGMLRQMGQPTKGAAISGNRTEEFSPTTFMSNLGGLGDDQVRALLFGNGPQREGLDVLAQALSNPKAMQRLQNFSNTANQGGRAGWYAGGITALPATATAWGGAAGLNKLMTSPGFARWLADGYRIPAGNAARVQAHIAKLQLIGKAAGWTAGQVQSLQNAFSQGDPNAE